MIRKLICKWCKEEKKEYLMHQSKTGICNDCADIIEEVIKYNESRNN